jgi:hypothetical protein
VKERGDDKGPAAWGQAGGTSGRFSDTKTPRRHTVVASNCRPATEEKLVNVVSCDLCGCSVVFFWQDVRIVGTCQSERKWLQSGGPTSPEWERIGELSVGSFHRSASH